MPGPSGLLIVADDAVPALWHLICCLRLNTEQSSNFGININSSTLLNRKFKPNGVLPKRQDRQFKANLRGKC
jgi:hypothetical protein